MIPSMVLPDDTALLPASSDAVVDGWSVKINLDPTKTWGVFSVAGSRGPFQVDQDHKSDEAPYVTVFVDPADLFANGTKSMRWRLSEDTVLARTFLTQQVKVVSQ